MGRITGTGIDRSGWTETNYVVRYAFPRPQATSLASPQRASLPVRLHDYKSARAGQEIVVLYDPRDPVKSIIYDYCDYCVKA